VLQTLDVPRPNCAVVDAAAMSNGADPLVTLTQIWMGERKRRAMGRREARNGEKKSFYFIFLRDLQSKTVSLRGGVFIFFAGQI